MENQFYKTNITAKIKTSNNPLVGDDVFVKKAMANLVDTCKSVGIFRNQDSQYIQGIYVSSGKNGNRDVFLPSELGKSFATSLMKPIDIDHIVVEKESIVETLKRHAGSDMLLSFGFGANTIIGAIYDAAFVDSISGDMILAREIEEKIPGIYEKLLAQDKEIISQIDRQDVRYDIVIAGILWNFIFPKTVAQIIDDINSGERALSMECWFSNYDWLVADRLYTKEEAPHLQNIWDNGGTVNGQSLGRVLRNITFGGGGAVKNPANTNAFDFMEVASIKQEGVYQARASLVKTEMIKTENLNDGGNEMDIKEVEQTLAKAVKEVGELTELKLELKSKASENETLSEKVNDLKEKLSASNTKIDELTKTLEEKSEANKKLEDEKIALAKELEDAKAALELKNKELESNMSELETVKASLKDMSEKVGEFELAQVIAKRIDELKSKEVLIDEAEDAKTVASLSDEDFTKLCEDRVKIAEKKSEAVVFDITSAQKKAVASFVQAGGKKVDTSMFSKYAKV